MPSSVDEVLNHSFLAGTKKVEEETTRKALEKNLPKPDDPLIKAKEEEPGGEEWYKDIDPVLQETAKKFKSPAGLLKSYRELEEYLSSSRKGISKPDKDAPESEWDAFYKSLGRPDDINEYGLKDKDQKEVTPYDGKNMLELKKSFKDAGLTKKQANKIIKFLDNTNRLARHDDDIASRKKRAEAFEELQRDWGPDEFTSNQKFAEKIFHRFLDVNDQKEFIKAGVDQMPGMLKLLVNVGKTIMDDNTIRDLRTERNGLDVKNNPDVISAEIKKWTQALSDPGLTPDQHNVAYKNWKVWKLKQDPNVFD